MKLDNDTFNKLIEENTLYLLKFSAKWCGPCKAYAPIYDEFSKDSDMQCFTVDCDESQDLVDKFKIMSIPCTILLKGSNELKKQNGFMSLEQLKDFACEGF